MFTRIHNANNNETVYASVRLNQEEHASLAEYMKSLDTGNGNINFPYGAFLIKRGYGWYKLMPNNDTRGIDKVNGALKIIKRWHNERVMQAKRENELKAKLARVSQDTQTKIVAFADNQYMLAAPVVPKPATPEQLVALQASLASKFSTRHVSK